jgi:hypothetical protein
VLPTTGAECPSPTPWLDQPLAPAGDREHAISMPDAPVERAEVVALLFDVSDIAVTLTNIERLPGRGRWRRRD